MSFILLIKSLAKPLSKVRLTFVMIAISFVIHSSIVVAGPIDEFIYSNGTINFKTLSFKVEVPGGASSIEWINAPAGIEEAYDFKSDDGVTYQLEGFLAYRAIYDNNLTTVNVRVTSETGVASQIDIPVSVVMDPSPEGVFLNPGPITFYKGQQSQLPVQITDAGKNITRIEVMMVPEGNALNDSVIVLGESRWEKELADNYGEGPFYYVFESLARTDLDSTSVNLPVDFSKNIPTGNYDLYLQITDSRGNISYSSTKSVQLSGPVNPPELIVVTPDYRIPAGQPYPISYQVSHLDYLDRIEIVQTGPTGATLNEQVTFTSNQFDVNGKAYLTLPATATSGDVYNLNITVYDVSGKSTTTLATVTTGGWGERTVTVTNTAMVDVDDSLNYADVIVTAGSSLRHVDGNIKFNNLTIDAGATFVSQADHLDINGALVVNGDIYVATEYNSITSSGGAHGGDGRYGVAYDSFRDPQLPGSNGNSSRYYPVDLNISAMDITVNGNLFARGQTNSVHPGGLLTITTNTLAVNGAINANAVGYAAGGSVNIKTGIISGAGHISTNGGDGSINGAGGSIAIHYESYGDGSVTLKQGLNLSSYPGIFTSSNYNVGAGTIFLKRTDQPYGDLYIENGGRPGGNTTLRSVGRHIIQNIELEAGTTDQYRITVEGYPWSISSKGSLDLGLKDLSVSLDANNTSAPIYPVTELLVPSTGIDQTETRTLAAAGTPGSVQFHSFSLNEAQTVEFSIIDANFNPHIYLFNDTGAITTSDVIANVSGSGATLRRSLAAGDYILAVGAYYLSSSEAATGINNDACNSCSYSLGMRQVNTGSFLVQSGSDLSANIGNDLIGVIRLDHFAAGSGAKILTQDRLHSTLFDIADSTNITGIEEVYSETSNNISDAVVSGETRIFVGDVNANNLTLDAASLSVYGALNVAGDLTVQNTVYAPLDISGSGVFATANTVGSVVYHNFIVHQASKVKISAISPDSSIGWYLFHDDGVLDSTDYIDHFQSSQTNNNVEGALDLEAGNYILALGRYSLTRSEAVSGISNIGGGNYNYNILGLDAYSSSVNARAFNVTGSININDTALSLATPATAHVGGDLNLSNATLTTLYADSAQQQIYPLYLDVQGAVRIDSGSRIDLTGKGYPAGWTIGFSSTDKSYSYAGEGGVSISSSISDRVYGDFVDPRYPGTGSNYAPGGGMLNLISGSIQLDGHISVNGDIPSSVNNPGGTGGSVFINTSVFNGSGNISASAGFSSEATNLSTSGSGGRISVVAQLDNFSAAGQYNANAGKVTGTGLYRQGAPGTIYLRADAGQPGDLVIDNTLDTVAQPTDRRTVLRSVGHHSITNIESMGGNNWRITVSGAPWTAPADSRDGLGLLELNVDLDASDEAGTLYRIIDNTSNSITVNTPDDLSGLPAASLIGVIELRQLTVAGGSQLYTEDRLVISDPVASIFESDSKITAGQMNGLAFSHFLAASSVGTLELVSPLEIADLTINDGTFLFSGGLSVTNSLVIGADASVDAQSITTNTITINGGRLKALSINVTDIGMAGGMLITENVSTSGNVSLLNSAVVTVPDSDNDRFYALNLNVSGQLHVELGSIIDLNGKGYTRGYQTNTRFNRYQGWYGSPGGYYPYGCHGGRSVSAHLNAINIANISRYGEYELCSYGDYIQANYPGLVNAAGEPGGGFAKIVANDLMLDGILRANGIQNETGGHSSEGASGGGLHIEVATLSGGGSIEARGGEDTVNYYGGTFNAGAGGRISIHYASSNTFAGTYDAGSGNAGTSGAVGGTGTVYLLDRTQNQSQLVLDNFHRRDTIATPSHTGIPTSIRSVGRHTVAAIDSLGSGLWRVHINSNKLDYSSQPGTLPTPQSVTYHQFSLNSDQAVRIGLPNFGYSHTIGLYNDDGSLDLSDFITHTTGALLSTNLAAGDYIVAVASGYASPDETVAGNNANNQMHTSNDGVSPNATGSITYTLTIDPGANSTWKINPEHGLAGRTVSLDAANPASAIYPIISNTAESFVIDAQDALLDLSGVVGNELVGVHILDTLNVRGKSVLDFGNDRLTLLQPLSSSVEAGSSLIFGEIDSATMETLLTTSTGRIVVKNNLTLNSLHLINNEIEVQGQLDVVNDLIVDGKALTATNISVGNNLNIVNGGVITVPAATLSSNDASKIHNLAINVAGAIDIDALSKIDLDGKGYPESYNGPDFSIATSPEYGCSGGISARAEAIDCTYGRYEQARFAGSGGSSPGDIGGGSLSVTANSLSNDGLITANGVGTVYGGAGGAIHIVVDSIFGNGAIQATSPHSSSGGRISVHATTTDLYTSIGSYSANSNIYAGVGGAGTIFITSPAYPDGYLIVDNNGNASLPYSTPVRSVGRHTIASAIRQDATHIQITVMGNPGWKASDAALDWGLDGLYVDLDARDQAGPVYPITTNTEATIIIDDSSASIADPSVLIGQDLIGTHTFDRLQVSNGASLDFGADRVIINDALAADFFGAGHIRMGELNQTALDIILSQLDDNTVLELTGNIVAATLNLSSGNISITGDLSITSNLILSDTVNMEVLGQLNVTGDIALGAYATLKALDVTANNVLIDGATLETSRLTVANDITILSTGQPGVLTAPPATFNPNRIYPLDIIAGNNILVNTGSLIDVAGKGYPARIVLNGVNFDYSGGPDFNYQNSVSCHAGKISQVIVGNCQTYGRIEEARFAGSGGRYTVVADGNGGGIIRVNATTLNNAGTINANGNIGYYGGAGGSIHIQVSNLLGSGVFSATGGGVPAASTSYRTGGGGRVSIYLPDSFANGIDMANVQAKGGASTYSNSGAGTVYLKYNNEAQGHLFVDNGGVTAAGFSTPIREVGRHVITSAVATGTTNSEGESLYELSIADRDAVHIKASGVVTQALPGTVVHHDFTLNTLRAVQIEITESEFSTHIYLFRKNANGYLTYVTNNNSSGRGYQSRLPNLSLDAGDYVVAVSSYYTNTNEASYKNKTSTTNFGAYKLSIDTLYDVPGDSWHAYDPVHGWGLDGLKLTLDPETPDADLYTIESNTEHSIIVASPVIDLTYLNTGGPYELLGVHEFETATVRGGAQVDFGADRILVSRPDESLIDAGSTLISEDVPMTLP